VQNSRKDRGHDEKTMGIWMGIGKLKVKEDRRADASF
jgi:hypothetical protein